MVATTFDDLTGEKFSCPGNSKNLPGVLQYKEREITGALLNGVRTASATTGYLVFEIPRNCVVQSCQVIVTDADSNAITLDVGYRYNSTSSDAAFCSSIALNSTGVKEETDSKVFFPSGITGKSFIQILPSGAVEDATRFIIRAIFSPVGIVDGEALTAPV